MPEEEIIYPVIFYTGKVHYLEETVSAGQTVNEPLPPTRDGYDFTGWYQDEAGTQPYGFSAPINHETRLYAGWKLKSHVVRFEACGPANPTTQVALHGSLASEPDVYYSGYLLDGWYTEADYINRYNFNTKVTGPLCLYAKWTLP